MKSSEKLSTKKVKVRTDKGLDPQDSLPGLYFIGTRSQLVAKEEGTDDLAQHNARNLGG